MRWSFGTAVALNPTAKLKIIYAFLQIVLMMPTIYGVWVPPEYYEWMKVFSWLQVAHHAVVASLHATLSHGLDLRGLSLDVSHTLHSTPHSLASR